MIRRPSRLILLCSFLPFVSMAQDNQAVSPSIASQQSAQATTEPTPASASETEKPKKVWTKAWPLYLVLVCQTACLQTTAQTQDPASAASNSQAPATAKTPSAEGEKKPADLTKPKKIWTNDEVGSLKGDVSVVGGNRQAESPTQPMRNGAGAAADARRAKIVRYRTAIAELRKKIDAADQRITQYKNFKADDSSPNGGVNPNRGYSMVPLDEQVKQLEEKKKQWLASIEDLENQAKKDGIEPGELR